MTIHEVLQPFLDRLHSGGLTSDAASQLATDLHDAVTEWEQSNNTVVVPEGEAASDQSAPAQESGDDSPTLVLPPSPDPIPVPPEPTPDPTVPPSPFPPFVATTTGSSITQLVLARDIVDLAGKITDKATALVRALNG